MIAAGLLQLWKKTKIIKRVRVGNKRRDRSLVLEEISTLPEYVFKSMFRMDRTCFELLLEKLSTYFAAADALDDIIDI